MKEYIGIDLGTSNSAIAFCESPEKEAQVAEITQVMSPGTIGEKKSLPSTLYLPYEGELAPGSTTLPWGDEAGVIGEWARGRGAEMPDRLVVSAKSWLCHAGVDRLGPILPWGEESSAPLSKISPVEASRRYLSHLKSALIHRRGTFDEKNAHVVLTVPASFDEVARQLTHEAAKVAGLADATLLEEPQAALYACIAGTGGQWRKQVHPGDLILVIDVGGGTTDFSLIAISEEDGNLRLERIAVGDHLLLGGDNMDLALAYSVRAELEAQGKPLDHWQFLSLVHSARLAKEKLLSDDSLSEVPIAVASRGASLFKKTLSTKLTRAQVLTLLLDGFFPLSPVTNMPAVRRSTGIQEVGLPFVADAGISRHLARFLTRSLENVRSDAQAVARLEGSPALKKTHLHPTAILFNGGVFNSPVLRARTLEILRAWSPDSEVKELEGANFDLAVAKGAAYYAACLGEGKGVRIKAGTARSYYLGLEPSMPAVPGFRPPIKGLCVVPQGLEEGSELKLEGREFGLVTGEPVEFRFFSSSVRAGDAPGAVVGNAEAELDETSRLEITLPPLEGKTGDVVPVNLDAVVTEVGTLELYMKHTQSNRKWNLEFNVRPKA